MASKASPPVQRPGAIKPGKLPPTLLTPELLEQMEAAGQTPAQEIVGWLATYLSTTPTAELVQALSYQGTVLDMSNQPAIASKYPEDGAWSRAHLITCGKSITRWMKGPPWGDTLSDKLIPRNAECYVDHLWRYRWMVESQAREANQTREANQVREPEKKRDDSLYH